MPDTAKARPSLSVIVLSHGDLGRVPRPHKTNGLLGTSALWGGGWLPLPLGVGAEILLLRGQAYTHCNRAGVTEPNCVAMLSSAPYYPPRVLRSLASSRVR